MNFKETKPTGKDKLYTRLKRPQIEAMIKKQPDLKLLIETFELITPEDIFFKDKKA